MRITLFILSVYLLVNVDVFANQSSSMCIGVRCKVLSGKPSISLNSNSTAPPFCPVRINNEILEYRITCPEGQRVCIRESVSQYEETATGSRVRIEDLDIEKTKLYSDPNCTEECNLNSETSFIFTRKSPTFKGALYCKINPDENKSLKYKVITVVDFTITY